ncbi:MAG TPA: LuxR C-terminal-related transcriptional regulator [Luteibacter sp.]|jgi:DNA-binding NarL/FixJ family response regulator|nr:LuxR C-terminal-related transcriptional regulator [Luteibacter sp.]
MDITAPAPPRRPNETSEGHAPATPIRRDTLLGLPLRPVERAMGRLTDLERQILNSIILGKTCEAIGEELSLDVAAVERHREEITTKLRPGRPEPV